MDVITGSQCRMARALLCINQNELAALSNVGLSTVVSIERANGLPRCKMASIQAVQDALIKTGRVVFTESGVAPPT